MLHIDEQFIVDNFDNALANGSIRAYYQPVIRTLTEKICSVEALARWQDPVMGLLSPFLFISVLEKYRMIHKLELYILENICITYNEMKEKGLPLHPFSINLSRLDFDEVDMLKAISDILQKYNVPSKAIHIEITESVMLDNTAYFRRIFDSFEMPELCELIDRPVVDSGTFTAEQNAETLRHVGREIALWRMFAERAEAEPETALLPALVHYREALRLLSSIRQENVALGSEDFKLFQRLRERRRRDVDEWFVVLDKAVAMGDWEKARSQAKWIISHATLNGERPDVRRAADILAAKIPAEESANND